jgi:ABC-2 type transport system permease protein
MGELLRPYLATFQARFQLMLQYRAAALAGFVTQSWFGGIMIMVLAAFYGAGHGHAAPLSLGQAVSYTWMSQAFLVLIPWGGDPPVTAAVRTGAVGYDRIRPIDAYAYWFSGAAGHMLARVLPRAALIAAFSIVALPLIGLQDWAWQLPASPLAAVAFALAMVQVVLLASAMVVLLNLSAVLTLDNKGVVSLSTAAGVLLSGNLLPLPLFPDWMRTFLFVQPFAGLMDIPFRIYLGELRGGGVLAGLAVQATWILVLIALGRYFIGGVMQRLQVQGG